MSEDLLDVTQLENLRQLFDEGFKGLVETFFSEFEEKEKILSNAIKNKKIDVITNTAHFLKGSSANMSAVKLSKICYDIEIAGRKNNFEEILKQYNAFQTIYAETKNAFLKIIK
jgi:histidine phosphotransfer protein HptB